jgi:hypothetical protein
MRASKALQTHLLPRTRPALANQIPLSIEVLDPLWLVAMPRDVIVPEVLKLGLGLRVRYLLEVGQGSIPEGAVGGDLPRTSAARVRRLEGG